MGNQCTQAPLDEFWEVNVSSWTAVHVYSWLSTVDNGELKPVATLFKKQKLSGADLIAISNDDKRLQTMRIAIGDRLHFKQALHALLMNRSLADLSPIPETSTVPHLQLSPSHTNKHPKQCAPQTNANPTQITHTLAPPPQPPIAMITPRTMPKYGAPPPIPYTHYNEGPSLIPTHDPNDSAGDSDNESESDSSDEDIPSKQELKILKLQSFKRSTTPIQVLKDIMSNSTSNQQGKDHFVMLDSPTHSSHHEDTCSSEEDEDGSDWRIKDHAYDTYQRFVPTFPVGARPGLVNMPSNRSTTLIHRAIGAPIAPVAPVSMPNDDDDEDHKGCMVMMNGYDDENENEEEDSEDMRLDFECDHINYFDTSEEDSYPYPAAIEQLTSQHHATLFMLQTTKKYLLNGYLRNEGIHKIMRIPKGITDVVLQYFDDSAMTFDIQITELLKKSTGFNKLEGAAFKFPLNMDHKIKLRPTLTHTIRTDMAEDIDAEEVDGMHEFHDIELALECEALPIKIDKCMVLINILCACHEIKYQKMDLYVFGTDLLGDHNDNNFNLLNKPGLKMIIPTNDIAHLNELQFKINATILDIEYDPNYDNHGIVPSYNSSLTMRKSIRYVWELNQRILSTLSKDIFRQKFYSSDFDQEFWCLDCYKHEEGQLVLQLNLLRLQCDIESIDCDSIIALKNNRQVIWSQRTNHHMDCQYNNAFKWKLDKASTNKLFRITDSKLINSDCDSRAPNISVEIEIKVTRMNEKRLKYEEDIYRYLSMQ